MSSLNIPRGQRELADRIRLREARPCLSDKAGLKGEEGLTPSSGT